MKSDPSATSVKAVQMEPETERLWGERIKQMSFKSGVKGRGIDGESEVGECDEVLRER